MESTPVQFSPSVYEHAARVIGRNPWEVSRDAELLSTAHIEAFRLYNHRPVVVGIDIYNLEAEAYGSAVERPSGTGVPAISRHPYSTVKELISLEPFNPKTDGRVPMVIEAAMRVADECPGADVRVPLSGPFSLATREPVMRDSNRSGFGCGCPGASCCRTGGVLQRNCPAGIGYCVFRIRGGPAADVTG